MFQARRTCLPGGDQGNDEIPSACDSLFVNNLADEVQWYVRGCGALRRGGKSWGSLGSSQEGGVSVRICSCLHCFFLGVSGLVSSLGHVCSPNSQEDPARQKETPPTFVKRLIGNSAWVIKRMIPYAVPKRGARGGGELH